MNKTHLRTYANHIRSARLNRAEALQIELAVMFSVIVECNSNKRLAREAIYDVYNTSGSYQCAQPTDRDWKSVGRSIRAGLALFSMLSEAEDIATWGEGLKHGEQINAYVEHIAPLKLATVNEVLSVCGEIKPPVARGEREAPEGSHVVNTPHMRLVIPPNVTADELMQVIGDLMAYANTLLDAGKVQDHPLRKAA
jgi:hypothetical protein